MSLCLLALVAGIPSRAQEDPLAAPAPAPAATEESDKPAGAADWKTRETVFLKKLVGMQAFYETVPGAISDHVRNFPEQWGRTWPGFGKRVASQYGQFVLSELIEGGVQAIHKEDPRYFRLGKGSFFRRLEYSVVSTFWVPKPGGGRTFAFSVPAGVYGSWAIATRWNPPDLQTPWKIVQWGSVGMGVKVSANSFREFWPDIKERVLKKK
ncbi:MAG TPA: hypothetical protein VMH28_33090 [Candidatus Acidoferrales bacterium]|nr:hypothetical protein [Candidatus Acidoferrales bacterium]